MKKITFDELCSSLRKIKFGEFDLIVAIGRGGITLGGLIQHILDIPMEILWLNFRDEENKMKYNLPVVIKENEALGKIRDKRILIVDDVCRTGKTIRMAKEILSGNSVKTFVFNGKADYNILDSSECVRLPWG